MAVATIIGGAVAAGGAALSARSQAREANSARRAQLGGLNEADRIRQELISEVEEGTFRERDGFDGFDQNDVFGVRPDEVNLSDSQIAAARGNLSASDSIDEFLRPTRVRISDQSLERAAQIDPNFRENLAALSDQARSFIRGEIPEDVLDRVVRDRAGLTALNGIAGTAQESTARDLGLTSLDLQDRGRSIFQEIGNIREQIDPISGQIGVRDFFVDPTRQFANDVQNAALRAAPDPAANQIFNLELQGGTQNAIARGNVQPRQSTGGAALSAGLNSFGGTILGSGGFGGSFFGGGRPQNQGNFLPNSVFANAPRAQVVGF